MLSRVANNLFWMDRYMERTNGLLNQMKSNYLSNREYNDPTSWEIIFKSYFDIDDITEFTNNDQIISFLIFNPDSGNSIINLIMNSRKNCRSVQEHISKEIWVNINKYFLFITDKKLTNRIKYKDPINLIEDLLTYNLLHYSNSDLTQERGNPYSFMNLGKYLERLSLSVDFLLYRLFSDKIENDSLKENIYWKNLLLSIGGYQTYVKTYKSSFLTQNLVELTLLNPNFPKSILYCLKKLKHHINRLNLFNGIFYENDVFYTISKLESKLKFTKSIDLKNNELKKYLENIKVEIHKLSNAVNKTYFEN